VVRPWVFIYFNFFLKIYKGIFVLLKIFYNHFLSLSDRLWGVDVDNLRNVIN
jgi:hypothetical protein